MISHHLQRELHESLQSLDATQQRQVLDYAKSLNRSAVRGTPGNDLLRFAGSLGDVDAADMLRAIEDGCEKVDQNGW